MLLRLLTSLFIFTAVFTTSLEAKPPQLTPRDTRVKIDEILKAHVSHQKLTEEIVTRSIQNYIDELDPGKTYFLEADIAEWTNPSQETLNQALEGYRKEDFSVFEKIHEAMLTAVDRRNELEKEIEKAPSVKNVQPSEFKDIKWAKTEEELTDRLIRIKSLQLQTAEKISPETKDQFFQRISKRRVNRESELAGASAGERKQIVLSYVLKSTSSALDSQTIYFTPTEASQFMIQVQQRLFGIGAQLRDDLNGFSIVRIVEGSPAAQSNKLKVGDKIVAVDQEPVVGMDIVEAVELIRGPQGSNVHLTVLRETKDGDLSKEDKLNIEIVRGEIVLKESRLETTYEPYGDGVIAVLHLYSFYQDSNSSSASDLAEAIEKLKKEHQIKGIILDLRNNAGGLLPQAVAVTGLFISKGVVVSVKDNSGQVQHLRNVENRKIWDGPLVVLTARTSASAAEIVAQTLQDYGRAIVIGDPETFGKGTFQTFTLESSNFGKVNPKGEYKVTRGRYYTVSGKSPQLVGVKADIVVPGIFSEMEIGEKYSKFPVETDEIAPNFIDDLSDVPVIHRAQLNKMYKTNLQTVMTTYQPYIELLTKNSEERLAQNKNYQNLLKEIAKKDDFADPSDFFGQNDLQLIETTNIMKDLIYFMEQKKAEPAEAA
ncbi:MAG: PDZ domain-containing protein [Verrucomicrobia bacterium]|nr:PDZ domain-containing protein [Verrucomicrobiota bacterium]